MSAATYPLSPFGRAGASYLAPDLTIRGRIETSGAVEMDCEFHGDVLARQASVGPNGRIRARISAEQATVSGEMTGIVNARQAFFRDGCHFRGEVEYESLGTEPNAEVDARLVPVLAGTSALTIPKVSDVPLQGPALSTPPVSPPTPSATAPRVNLSMLAFLGGMIVAGVVTGIMVVNPTTREWKDQLLEHVMQPRADAVPPATVASQPAETTVASDAPQITPPPPPAIPPSLSKILPAAPATSSSKDAAVPTVNSLETTPATPAPVATPAPTAPPVVATVAVPDLSPAQPLPRHEPVDQPLPAPQPSVAATEPVAPTPVAPVIEPPVPVVAAAPKAEPVPMTSQPVEQNAPAPVKAETAPPPAKPEPVAAESTKETKQATTLPATPAQTPTPAAGKKTKIPGLPAGARGALQEVCTWELKCDSDNQCVSVRSCKMQ